MAKRMNKKSPNIRDLNIIDMILIDHRRLKSCIEILINEDSGKNDKLETGKDFIMALNQHGEAEEKVVYSVLKNEDEFHFNILEAEIEHRLFDEKVKMLRPKLNHTKILKDEIEAELKILAEIVKNHLKEEESELLPKMNEHLEEEILKRMGHEFMKLRKLNSADLENYPHLQDELVSWKDDVQKISSQFLSKMDKYVENLKH